MTWLESLPLTLAGAAIFVLLFAGFEVGLRLPRRRATGTEGPTHLLSAVLGLLALLLGFTFSLALNRHETRRDLVLQEANAIGTTWLRAQLAAEPERTALRTLLRDYADARVAWSLAEDDPAALARTGGLQRELWDATGAVVRAAPGAQLTRALLDAMNQSFDLATARVALRAAHIPAEVMTTLLLYAVLSMVMLGYILGGTGHPYRFATAMLVGLLALALVLILDLDQPREGRIQVSQQPMLDVRESIRDTP